MVYFMNKCLLLCLMSAFLVWPDASAQRGPMDTCEDQRACDAAADEIIARAQSVSAKGRHREAARIIYPAVLSRKTSPLGKARAADALSELLVAAELFEYAAVQKRNAIEATRAPSSAELLAHARLVAKGTRKERTLRAYDDVEKLAIASANLETIDAIIADYTRLGERARVSALRAKRPEIQARSDAACAQVDCRSSAVVDAKVQEIGPIEYPSEARRREVGDCRVTLNVTEDGRPVDLASDCSAPVFVEAAMIAVQESSFTPRYENGVPRPRYNVVMPFEFQPGGR